MLLLINLGHLFGEAPLGLACHCFLQIILIDFQELGSVLQDLDDNPEVELGFLVDVRLRSNMGYEEEVLQTNIIRD